MTEIRLRPMYRWLLGLGLAGALILMLPIRVAEPESEAPKTIRSNDAAQVVVPASVAQLVGDPLVAMIWSRTQIADCLRIICMQRS